MNYLRNFDECSDDELEDLVAEVDENKGRKSNE